MGEIVGRHGAVVGIDISTDLIALCNRRKASTWLCGDRSADHGGGTPGTADACPYRNAAGIELWEARYKDRAAKRAKAYKIVR
jgi:hypothetical protein